MCVNVQWKRGSMVDSVIPARQIAQNNKSSLSREEFEVVATWNSSKKGDKQANHLLEWATNPQFRSYRIRERNMKTLQKKVLDEILPDGILREDFTDPSGLDGAQKMVFYFRSPYEAIKQLLRNARFAGSQYTQADVLYNRNGTRKLGHLNRSGMYEECQFSAMEGLSYGVSPVPIFLSSDSTVICKKMGGHPIIRKSLLPAQAVNFKFNFETATAPVLAS